MAPLCWLQQKASLTFLWPSVCLWCRRVLQPVWHLDLQESMWHPSPCNKTPPLKYSLSFVIAWSDRSGRQQCTVSLLATGHSSCLWNCSCVDSVRLWKGPLVLFSNPSAWINPESSRVTDVIHLMFLFLRLMFWQRCSCVPRVAFWSSAPSFLRSYLFPLKSTEAHN